MGGSGHRLGRASGLIQTTLTLPLFRAQSNERKRLACKPEKGGACVWTVVEAGIALRHAESAERLKGCPQSRAICTTAPAISSKCPMQRESVRAACARFT